MTDPRLPLELSSVAARYRLNLVSGEEIKALATMLVEAGHWSDTLDEVYTCVNPIMSEVGPWFEVILRDEGISMPTKDEAVWLLLRSHLGEIACGVLPPREGMHWVMEGMYDLADVPTEEGKYIGETHGIAKLVGLYYSYDDLEERPDEVSCDGLYGDAAVGALGRRIVNAAQQWIEKHGDRAKSPP